MKVKDLRGKDRYLKFKAIDWAALSKSKFQKACKDILFLHWNGDSVGEEIQVPGSKMHFDFINLNKKIVVECQGKQHDKFNPFFHNKNIFNFVSSRERDEKKRKFCELNEFLLIEVRSAEELNTLLIEMEKGK